MTSTFISNVRKSINKNCAASSHRLNLIKNTVVLYGREDNKFRIVVGKLKRNRSGRYIINMNETIQAIKKALPENYNFEYVRELSKLSFCQQMKLFERAKIFISPEGAHLTLGSFVMQQDTALLVLYGLCKGQITPECSDDTCTGGGIAGPIWFTAAAHFNQLIVKKLSFCRGGKYSYDDEAIAIESPKLIYELKRIISLSN